MCKIEDPNVAKVFKVIYDLKTTTSSVILLKTLKIFFQKRMDINISYFGSILILLPGIPAPPVLPLLFSPLSSLLQSRAITQVKYKMEYSNTEQ